MNFERENRYTVLKNCDVTEALDADETERLIYLLGRVDEYREEVGKMPLECVVVESDWPEYETTWAAIEARVTAEAEGQ